MGGGWNQKCLCHTQKKQKTLGCIREIQVCKLRTKTYSQKRLTAMLYACVCIAECVTSVASFLVNAIGIVVLFAVLIVGNPGHHHDLPEASLQAVCTTAGTASWHKPFSAPSTVGGVVIVTVT